MFNSVNFIDWRRVQLIKIMCVSFCVMLLYVLLSLVFITIIHKYFDHKLNEYNEWHNMLVNNNKFDKKYSKDKMQKIKHIEKQVMPHNQHILDVLDTLTLKIPESVHFTRIIYANDTWELQGLENRVDSRVTWGNILGEKIVSLSLNNAKHVFKLKMI